MTALRTVVGGVVATVTGFVLLLVVILGADVTVAQAMSCSPALVAPAAPGGPPPRDDGAGAPAALVAARAAKAAGFPRDEMVTAVAVAGGESEWNPGVTNANTDGSTDYGLWQINSVHAGLLAAGNWRDPGDNARMAFAIWQQSGWQPWVAHSTGRYQQFLPTAKLVVAQLADGDDEIEDPVDPTVPIDFGCDPGEASGGGHATDAIPCAAGTDGDVQQGPDGVPIRVCQVGGFVVDTTLAPKLAQMLAAAKAAGVRLGGSGYRSHIRQIQLRRAHCGPSRYDIWQRPAGQCTPPTAKPGQSMHEWGLALDLTANGSSITSRGNPAWIWLNLHAGTYGLRNLPSEPWHWSTNGR